MTEPTQPLSLARLYQLRLTLTAAAEGSTCRDDMVDTYAEADELLDDALLVRGMFSWADVDCLREIASEGDHQWIDGLNTVPNPEISSLADRLASILPPRAS